MATDAEREDPFIGYGRSLLRETIRQDAPLPQNDPFGGGDVPPVGILGGGMAGLYTALILQSLKVPFQIIEGTNRVGGRCFTYKFEEGGEYDYYDVGAMRFPLPDAKDPEGPHKRLKKLFEKLGVPLMPYYYKNKQGLMYFNGLHATIGEDKFDFNAEALGVAECYRKVGADEICKDFLKDPLKPLLDHPGSKGWNMFKEEYDKYSTRSYLQFKYRPTRLGLPDEPMPTAVIDWLETFDKSSGWYDRALSETVLEAIAFGVAPGMPAPDWKCIDHGTSTLPNMALQRIRDESKSVPNMPEQPIIMQAPITAIRASDPSDKLSPLVVTAGGKDYTYSHVISTVPLPNFSFIDTSSLNVSVMQRNAIRQLQYGPSIKVGILFKTAWWKELGQKPGGQSFTDLPVRTIVYPSYDEKDQSSRVLIASYCWTNDAERLGNIIDNNVDGILIDVVLRDLAVVHKIDVDDLKKEYINHHAWNWNHDAWTGGAFAFFGPGQYEYFYDALNAPAADGRLQWAGELLSVRHAWIVGALDSAWAAVLRYLILINARYDKFKFFFDNWGANLEWDDGRDRFDSPNGPGGEEPLAIPMEHNLLLKHIARHNPNQETIPSAPTWS